MAKSISLDGSQLGLSNGLTSAIKDMTLSHRR